MKKSILIVIALMVCLKAGAVDIIKTDSLFRYNNQTFEAYEPVVIKGTYDVLLVSTIKLSYLLNNESHSVDVALSDGNWSATLGSFLPGQSIVLKFDVMAKADGKTIERLRDDFVKKFGNVADSISMNRRTEDALTAKLKNRVITTTAKSLSPDFEKLKDEDGKSFKAYLLEEVDKPQKFQGIIKAMQELLNIKNKINLTSDDIKKVNPDLYNRIAPSLQNYVSAKLYDSKSALPVVDESQVEESNKRAVNNLNQLYSDYDSKRSLIRKMSDDMVPSVELLTSLSFQYSLSISQTIKFPIRNFIGFELMPAYFINSNINSTFGMFFAASPYFGRIDPDEKIFQNDGLWKNFKRFVTPTVGIGIATAPKTNQVSPLIYAGIGLRMNNIVRISIGNTFFTKKYTNPADGSDPIISSGSCFTVGIGLSTDYLADFMKIFSTTINQFGK